MFGKHPKGVLAVILVNMFTRFAHYVLMTIFFVFLLTKFGFSEEKVSIVYSVFYTMVFVLSFVGGVIADKTRNYKGTILWGIILMAIGYLFMAIPIPLGLSGVFWIMTSVALFLVALGNGLFNGNLRVVLGQMYNAPNYSSMRDSGFLWLSLLVDIGALVASRVAVGIRDYSISNKGFVFDRHITNLCREYISVGENMSGYDYLKGFISTCGHEAMETSEFVTQYLHALTTGFHYVLLFAVAAAMISLFLYFRYVKKIPDPAKPDNMAPRLDAQQIRKRVYAFLAVLGIVNLFAIAFYQKDFVLNYFANDYLGLRPSELVFFGGNTVVPIILGLVVLMVFGVLRAIGKEPSTLKKMAIGMGIAAIAFIIMSLASIGLSKFSMAGEDRLADVQQLLRLFFFMISSLILTAAGSFVYPLLASFVSQYARPKYQGIMQSVSMITAYGSSSLLFLGEIMYRYIPTWAMWAIYAGVCVISMTSLLLLLKWVDKTLESTRH